MLGAEAEPQSSVGRALTLGTEPKAWKWAASCCTASSRRAASAYSPRSTARCSWSADVTYLLANVATLIHLRSNAHRDSSALKMACPYHLRCSTESEDSNRCLQRPASGALKAECASAGCT